MKKTIPSNHKYSDDGKLIITLPDGSIMTDGIDFFMMSEEESQRMDRQFNPNDICWNYEDPDLIY